MLIISFEISVCFIFNKEEKLKASIYLSAPLSKGSSKQPSFINERNNTICYILSLWRAAQTCVITAESITTHLQQYQCQMNPVIPPGEVALSLRNLDYVSQFFRGNVLCQIYDPADIPKLRQANLYIRHIASGIIFLIK